MGDRKFKTITEFVNLGSLLTRDNKIKAKIKRRITMANRTHLGLNKQLKLGLLPIVQLLGYPNKIIRLFKGLLDSSKAQVRRDRMSESFNILEGLRQRDGLSTLLFNLTLEKVIELQGK